MLKSKKIYISLILMLTLAFNLSAADILTALKHIPEVSDIKKITTNGFIESYTFNFEQPIDHRNPSLGTFKQRVVLQHNRPSSPVVTVLEGYMIWGYTKSEPCRILDGNQVIIEHRFFAESVPADGVIPWEHLTVYNAAHDQHRIIQALKERVYKDNKWLTTGISKGGQTTIFHRFFFPDDVDVSIPYVAPLNLDFVDPRLQKNLNRLGSGKGKATKILAGNSDDAPKFMIEDFQIHCFEIFDEMFPLFEKEIKEKGYTYNSVGGNRRALELMILEYPFAFWQGGETVTSIPNIAIDQSHEFYEHLAKVSPPSFFDDNEIKIFRPFFYQALTEIGFYDYKVRPFKKYLPNDKENITFEFCLDEAAKEAASKIEYNRDKMRYIAKWLQEEARKMIFIYGGNDAWSGTQVDLKKNKFCYKFVCEDQAHGACIEDFEAVTRDYIKDKITDWMN